MEIVELIFALLQGCDTLFQVRAREPSRVACVDGQGLAALCHDEPALGVALLYRILAIVAARVHGTEARLAEFCGIAQEVRPNGPVGCALGP